ncbi:DUF6311 domain-containing protein [Pelagicoccus enzymogenes]|uniref:DUF6311 domain-containing protein n=1 Tax=Pelagicoccus enzymogenes TaxID=2773457 RepID=UPI00280D83B4|nr:DUF6311 domain-containing protein [Pelagicoccus enzymogenes]MDQ8199113.1 DUF6311 domain-containing protein [Pelagicoccus enzymogenes]
MNTFSKIKSFIPDADSGVAYVFYFIIGIYCYSFHAGWGLLTAYHDGTDFIYIGDTLQSHTGMLYYIQDEWRFPLFEIPKLAFEEGGANVINTDSNPIMALLAKIVFKITGYQMDYIGAWLFICAGLQSVSFCYLVSRFRSMSWVIGILGSVLIIFTPFFLGRFGHVALCSQFVLLFSIALYFEGRKNFRRASIGLLSILFFSLFVTAYLFAMVLGFLAVHWLQGVFERRIVLKTLLRNVCLLVGTIALCALGMGYYVPGRPAGASGGYGFYSMNILSPVWPQRSGLFPGNHALLDMTGGQHEGMSWLGTGGLLMLAVALVLSVLGFSVAAVRRHFWLCAYVVFLLLFAVSNVAWFGHWLLYDIDLNQSIYNFLSQFRSGGRMFWPVGYLILALGFICVSNVRFGSMLLSVIVVIQVVDVKPFLHGEIYQHRPSQKDQEFMEMVHLLAEKSDELYLLPSFGESARHPYIDLHLQAQFAAAKSNIAISHGYTNRRFTSEMVHEVQMRILEAGPSGGNSYIFLKDLIKESDFGWFVGNGRKAFEMNGCLVVPSDSAVQEFSQLPGVSPFEAEIASAAIGVDYVAEDLFPMLQGDFEFPGEGVWLDAVYGRIVAQLPEFAGDEVHLELDGNPYLSKNLTNRTVRLRVGGQILGKREHNWPESEIGMFRLAIPRELIKSDNLLELDFVFEESPSLLQLGDNGDVRRLGFYLRRMRFEEN